MPQLDVKAGICSSYNWEEATYLAGELWETLAHTLKIPTEFYAVDTPTSGLHFRWDQKLQHRKTVSFTGWLSALDVVIWFKIVPELLKQAQRNSIKHYLVYLPNAQCSTSKIEHLSVFHRIICPTRDAYAQLKTKVPENRLVYVPWDIAQPLREREPRKREPTHLVIAMETMAAKAVSPALFGLLRMLLDAIPSASVEIIRGKRWPTPVAAPLEELLLVHKGRIKIHSRPNYSQLAEIYRDASWVLCPDATADVGESALRAVCLGRPVITFNAPPYSELLQPSHNAHLVRCGVSKDESAKTQIQPNMHELYLGLLDAMQKPYLWGLVMNADWAGLEQRRRDFLAFWHNLLRTPKCVQ